MIRASVLIIALLPLAMPISATPTLTNTHTEALSPAADTDLAGARVSLAGSDASTHQLTTLLNVTGITPHLPDIHTMVEEARARHIRRCYAEASDRHKTRSYSARIIHNQLIDSLRKAISPDKLATVLSWYHSDVGKRVVLSEKRHRPNASFETVLTEAKQSPNWIERQSLIKKIEKYTQANRLGAIAGIETEHGGLMLSGCIETYSKLLASTATTDNLDDALGSRTNRELMMAKIILAEKTRFEQHNYLDTLDGITFSLQDVSAGDLAEYARFAAGPDARHVFTALVDAIEQTLHNASNPYSSDQSLKDTGNLSPITTQLDQ